MNRKHFKTTLKEPKTLLSGKLISDAAVAPPNTIIMLGMSIKGPSPPPPMAIDAKISPEPRIRPMIVAISIATKCFRAAALAAMRV